MKEKQRQVTISLVMSFVVMLLPVILIQLTATYPAGVDEVVILFSAVPLLPIYFLGFPIASKYLFVACAMPWVLFLLLPSLFILRNGRHQIFLYFLAGFYSILNVLIGLFLIGAVRA